jgi:pimeloyl-ACP methyl ester carboxylesterase
MKSSSKLYPVSLIRAEIVAEKFIEDTYLVKPNNSQDKSVQIAVTRLGYYNATPDQNRQPIILVHGSFTNRGFWFSHKGKGLARGLLEAGFDPWMFEMRGHGDSPENQDYKNNTIESYAKFDLPAVLKFVSEQTGAKPIWIGHSMGGVSVATAIALEMITSNNSHGVILLGAQTSKYPLLIRLPGFRFIARALLTLKKPLIKSSKGPEHEPLGIAKEFARWAGYMHSWKGKGGVKFWASLKNHSIPVLAFGAKSDKGDPAKHCKKLALSIDENAEFHELSKQNGYSINYNHVNMIIGDESKAEVWPQIINWINTTKDRQQND